MFISNKIFIPFYFAQLTVSRSTAAKYYLSKHQFVTDGKGRMFRWAMQDGEYGMLTMLTMLYLQKLNDKKREDTFNKYLLFECDTMLYRNYRVGRNQFFLSESKFWK